MDLSSGQVLLLSFEPVLSVSRRLLVVLSSGSVGDGSDSDQVSSLLSSFSTLFTLFYVIGDI